MILKVSTQVFFRFVCLLATCGLTGCEYQYDYAFVVVNKTNTSYEADMTTIISRDTVSLPANDSVEIFRFFGGIAGEHLVPGDRRNFKWELDSLFILVTDSTRSRNLAGSHLWSFTAEERLGIYTLDLTEDLID